MGAVAAGLKRAGVARSEVAEYRAEAMMGDYNNLLRVFNGMGECSMTTETETHQGWANRETWAMKLASEQ